MTLGIVSACSGTLKVRSSVEILFAIDPPELAAKGLSTMKITTHTMFPSPLLSNVSDSLKWMHWSLAAGGAVKTRADYCNG